MNKAQIFLLLLLFPCFTIHAQSTIRFNNTIDYQALYPATITAFKISPAVLFTGEQELYQGAAISKYAYSLSTVSGYEKLFCAANFKDSGQFKSTDNQLVYPAKKKKDFHSPAVHRWSIKNILCAVCDYMNKGVSAKYQPATLLVAATRSATR